MLVYKYRRDLYRENTHTLIYFETMCYIRRVRQNSAVSFTRNDWFSLVDSERTRIQPNPKGRAEPEKQRGKK